MLFRNENIYADEVEILANIEQLNCIIDKVIEENVAEMDCESPCSSTSMEIAEFNSPGQMPSNKDSENVEEIDDTSSTDENEVNLPPGLYSNSTPLNCEFQ